MKHYLDFEEMVLSEFGAKSTRPRATKRWTVKPKDGSPSIGNVSWHGAWRCYCFFPHAGTVFERTCLRDIADFCEAQTKGQMLRAMTKRREAQEIDQ